MIFSCNSSPCRFSGSICSSLFVYLRADLYSCLMIGNITAFKTNTAGHIIICIWMCHHRQRSRGGCNPLKQKFRGTQPPMFQCQSMSGYYKNHVRRFQQNSCHQNATRRGLQTVKVVFDITCGIGDFRVYIFCPMST